MICGLIWNNDGCLWFQEEPREECNNNRETQVERLQQVGTRYLYLLLLIIILTNYWTIKKKKNKDLVHIDEEKKKGEMKG